MRLPRRVPPPVAKTDLNGKSCVVTGASSGIGLEIARGLAERGAEVYLVGRDPQRTQAAAASIRHGSGNPALHTLLCDFADLRQVVELAHELGELTPKLDLLVNNAGLWSVRRKLSRQGIEMTFQVNHLASFLLTRKLTPLLAAGAPARVVNVSSRLHLKERGLALDDVGFERRKYNGLAAYRQSKLANVLFSNELARRHDPLALSAHSAHPGDVATNVTRTSPVVQWLSDNVGRLFLLTPEEGARTPLYAATSPELEGVSGKYFQDCAAHPPAPAALDPELAQQLWVLSERMLDEAGLA